MHAYSKVYLEDVVENQGKLFDFVAYHFPDKDTKGFATDVYIEHKKGRQHGK